MPRLSLDRIIGIVAGKTTLAANSLRHTVASGYSIDTRHLRSGDLFFALQGEHADGHDFVADASRKGASAAVVSRPVADAPGDFAQIVVPSPLQALQQLAYDVRARLRIPVIAVSGSNGKTTTKEMTALVLSARMRVHKSPGNFNNHIGVPLSILGTEETDQVMVLEMGSNHRGEIQRLCQMARPDVGVITNVGQAHVGLFGSLESVALEKTDLARYLSPGGKVLVNSDDSRLMSALKDVDVPMVRFGLKEDAAFRATEVKSIDGSGIEFTIDDIRVALKVPGEHNVYNALAALATSSLFGISAREAAEILLRFEPLRMKTAVYAGLVVIDDSYNANPDSVKAALEVLSSTKGLRKLLVLGEMLELGGESEKLHREVGSWVAASGIDMLVGIGGLTSRAVAQARESGMPAEGALFFDTKAEAKRHLQRVLRQGDAILVKGSRMTGLEEICDFLKQATVEGRI